MNFNTEEYRKKYQAERAIRIAQEEHEQASEELRYKHLLPYELGSLRTIKPKHSPEISNILETRKIITLYGTKRQWMPYVVDVMSKDIAEYIKRYAEYRYDIVTGWDVAGTRKMPKKPPKKGKRFSAEFGDYVEFDLDKPKESLKDCVQMIEIPDILIIDLSDACKSTVLGQNLFRVTQQRKTHPKENRKTVIICPYEGYWLENTFSTKNEPWVMDVLKMYSSMTFPPCLENLVVPLGERGLWGDY